MAQRPARGRSAMNLETGGANRDRTGDLLLAKQALSQLSYGPFCPEFIGLIEGAFVPTPSWRARRAALRDARPTYAV